MDISILKEAGLTEGEVKVYLALIRLGLTTIGPIVKESHVAHSIIYKILDNLKEKGLVSYIVKEKTKHFQAAQPQKIIDYIEERKEKLNESKQKIEQLLPKIMAFAQPAEGVSAQVFEGFKGFITAWEICYTKLKKGEEYHSWGVYPYQEERFHLYWQRDHKRREKVGFNGKILFNQGTDLKILRNRNSYRGLEARYMPTPLQTPAWFVVYKDVTNISLQTRKGIKNTEEISKINIPFSVVIINQEIADTFEVFFQDLWKRSKKLRYR